MSLLKYAKANRGRVSAIASAYAASLERGEVMFHKRKAPDEPFTHSPDCRIVAVDPGVQIPWGEIRRGVWEARCQCGVQYHHDTVTDDRVRLDPLDPKTARHAGQCEFAAETDPSTLRVLLKVAERDGYWWVACGSCEYGWQVLFFAESVSA